MRAMRASVCLSSVVTLLIAGLGFGATAAQAATSGLATVTLHDIADTTVVNGRVGVPHLPILADTNHLTAAASFAFTAPTGVTEDSPYVGAQMHVYTFAAGKMCIYRAAVSSPIIETRKQRVPPFSYFITCAAVARGWNSIDISADTNGEIHSDNNGATYIFDGGHAVVAARESRKLAPYVDIEVHPIGTSG